MLVLKFGGAALSDSKSVHTSVEYIRKTVHRNPVVVVSAMKGITDCLIDLVCNSVERNHNGRRKQITEIMIRHSEVILSLVRTDEIKRSLFRYLEQQIANLNGWCNIILTRGTCPPETHDAIVATGEKLSSHLIAALLRDREIDAEQVPGEELFVTDSVFMNAYPDMVETEKRIRAALPGIVEKGTVPVIAGFTGKDREGRTTTLGRGGTDFSAAVVAGALKAEEVWFMKDVDGLLSADPRFVNNPRQISKISYSEASEMAYFGAEVLHPVAVRPLWDHGIPAVIKNVFNDECEGTFIENEINESAVEARALACIRKVCSAKIKFNGSKTVLSGTAKILDSLGRNNIEVYTVSQSDASGTVLLILKETNRNKVSKIIETELSSIPAKEVSITNGDSLVSVIGNGIALSNRICGNILTTLEKSGISASFTSQSPLSNNISVLVDSSEAENAVNCLHELLFTEE